ncbi:MAG: SAM-dependent methyltransferase [Verrucomicrobiaceae bacterium]|nr:SAM-dependent methyltransferase [Verrucomicrobiaceae bacterium]
MHEKARPGVFATRSTNRPSAIGLSLASLIPIEFFHG